MHARWDLVFNRGNNKNSLKSKIYKEGKLLPVKTAGQLLASSQHQTYIQKLKQCSNLPDEYFSELYQSLVLRFSEFVQVLPEEVNGGSLCELLNNGLLRALNTLDLFIKEHDRTTPVQRYAIYTAALLQDISTVVVKYKIFITDNSGKTIKEWQPFTGPITQDKQAKLYKLIPLGTFYERMARSVNVLLSRQLIGEKGFLWIASDSYLLADWLESLGGEGGEGTMRLTHTIKLYMARLPSGLMDSLPTVDVDQQESPATEQAETLFAWLRSGLADGSISYNQVDSDIHVTAQGVFVGKEFFVKGFKALYGSSNIFSVFEQFGNLFGAPCYGELDFHHRNIFSQKTLAQRVGFLIETAALFSKSPPAVSRHLSFNAQQVQQLKSYLPAMTSVVNYVRSRFSPGPGPGAGSKNH